MCKPISKKKRIETEKGVSVELGVEGIDGNRFGGAGQQRRLQGQVADPARGGFVRLHDYSHSMVPVGFGVMS